MRRFKIADDLIEKHGYPQLTAEVKDQILGLNAARLLGVDPRRRAKGDQGRQAQRPARASAGTIPRRGATPSTAGSGSKTAATRRRPSGRDKKGGGRRAEGGARRWIRLRPWGRDSCDPSHILRNGTGSKKACCS